jgi:hypothetical protein
MFSFSGEEILPAEVNLTLVGAPLSRTTRSLRYFPEEYPWGPVPQDDGMPNV